jgi:hypothetical protein
VSLSWWADNDLAWDVLILGGEVWPGVCTVETTVKRALDKQKIKGGDGANLVDQGYEPAPVKITIRMWLREQWLELQRLLPSVHPRTKGGVRTPLQIVHPEPNLKGVHQIYIEELSPLTASKGLGTITISAVEWFPEPKPAKQKAKPKDGGKIPSAADVLPPNADGSAAHNII